MIKFTVFRRDSASEKWVLWPEGQAALDNKVGPVKPLRHILTGRPGSQWCTTDLRGQFQGWQRAGLQTGNLELTLGELRDMPWWYQVFEYKAQVPEKDYLEWMGEREGQGAPEGYGHFYGDNLLVLTPSQYEMWSSYTSFTFAENLSERKKLSLRLGFLNSNAGVDVSGLCLSEPIEVYIAASWRVRPLRESPLGQWVFSLEETPGDRVLVRFDFPNLNRLRGY